MRAMTLQQAGAPLVERDIASPSPGAGQVLVRVRACGVCRTDLHIQAGELTRPKLPLVLGHEIVGTVVRAGEGATRFAAGAMVGVPWLGWTCGVCRFCLSGRENLCDRARFTGYDVDGGYAELAVADERYCFPIPPGYDAVHAAPLLCAGLIGFRSLTAAGDARPAGPLRVRSRGPHRGAGGPASGAARLCLHPPGRSRGSGVRPGARRRVGRRLGRGAARAAGRRDPVRARGRAGPAALRATERGGTVVCAGIHMSAIPTFPYELLWGERVVRSVANLTRQDGEAFFRIAARAALEVVTQAFPLRQANDAMERVRSGRVRGAAVLMP